MRHPSYKKTAISIKSLSAREGDFPVHEANKEEHLLLEQSVFQMNMQQGTSMQEVADHLLKGIERLYPGAVCSILRLAEDNTLHHFSAPHLPEEYIQLIDGSEAGPMAGSCGKAASTDKIVVVSDIENDPVWRDYRSAALRFSLKACWSVPIHYSNGNVLGAFAIYYHHVARPSAAMLVYIERWASLIGILMENHEMVNKLRLLNERYVLASKATHDILWDWDLEKDIIYRDGDVMLAIYGKSSLPAVQSVNDWTERIHPDDRFAVVKQMTRIRTSVNEDLYKAEYRFLKDDGSYLHIYDRGYVMRDASGRPMRVIGAAQDITKRILNQEKLMKANILMQEKARKEIGYELHDNVNQLLGASKLYLESIPALKGEPEEFRSEGIKLIRQAIEEIRILTKSLVPPRLADVGLVNSIKDLIGSIEKTLSIEIDFIWQLDEKAIDEDIKLAVYRIVQEQANNIIKYAQATTVKIDLRQDVHGISLSITDNGVGFEPAERREGIGFTNIMNRAMMYNGRIKINAAPGKGCTLFVYLPFDAYNLSPTQVPG